MSDIHLSLPVLREQDYSIMVRGHQPQTLAIGDLVYRHGGEHIGTVLDLARDEAWIDWSTRDNEPLDASAVPRQDIRLLADGRWHYNAPLPVANPGLLMTQDDPVGDLFGRLMWTILAAIVGAVAGAVVYLLIGRHIINAIQAIS